MKMIQRDTGKKAQGEKFLGKAWGREIYLQIPQRAV